MKISGVRGTKTPAASVSPVQSTQEPPAAAAKAPANGEGGSSVRGAGRSGDERAVAPAPKAAADDAEGADAAAEKDGK